MRGLRSRGAAIIIAAALAATMAGCTAPQPAGGTGGTLTVGLITDSSGNLNPFTTTSGYPLGLVYDSLVRLEDVEGKSFEFVGVLATEWEFDEDFDQIFVELRDDIEFSDGTPFNAEVVKRNFEESVKHAASYAALMGEASVEVTGEYSVTISWDYVLAPDRVLEYLGGGMVSGAALDDVEALANDPVGGSGPYLYDAEASSPGSQLTFVRNPDGYWNPDVYQWDEVVVKEFSDTVAILNALKSGQIDFGPVELASAREAEASGLVLAEAKGKASGLYFVDRDGSIVPALGDVRVRQAISMAFDRQAIVDAVELGFGEPSNQAWAGSWPQYHPELEDRYPYDPEAARELLAEAGYPDGFDLTIPSSGTPYEPAVEQALADIGIRVIWDPAPQSDYFTIANSGRWPVLLNIGSYGPFYVANQEPFYVSSEGFYNVLAEPIPEVDELLETIKFGDEGASDAAASELGEYILDEAWFAIISHPYTLWAHSPDIIVEEGAGSNYGTGPGIFDMRPAD